MKCHTLLSEKNSCFLFFGIASKAPALVLGGGTSHQLFEGVGEVGDVLIAPLFSDFLDFDLKVF